MTVVPRLGIEPGTPGFNRIIIRQSGLLPLTRLYNGNVTVVQTGVLWCDCFRFIWIEVKVNYRTGSCVCSQMSVMIINRSILIVGLTIEFNCSIFLLYRFRYWDGYDGWSSMKILVLLVLAIWTFTMVNTQGKLYLAECMFCLFLWYFTLFSTIVQLY